ncbi:hypothetical protein H6P81_003780 [Aristolochia fimbriata]|uniref:ARM repeat superfamily protein n=1 Tax=Aristolochia fimbriata TaxID=158543 RepID=A0AAV7FHC0_ARIFI|nr:hypothetical protein H6P81_003780 [Aristolochia fimbriata]
MATPSPAELREGEGKQDDEEEATELESIPYHPPAPPSDLINTETTVDPSYIISLIRRLLPPTIKVNDEKQGQYSQDQKIGSGEWNSADINMEHENEQRMESTNGYEVSLPLDPWEECGCILWDLSADNSHAEFMVENFLLDVLLASLTVSESMRTREICLGIIANLACHEALRKHLFSTNGLIGTVVDQLFVDDSPCLVETFRLLTVGLQGCGALTLAEQLQSDSIMSRILWIAENTLNAQLLERCMAFFSVILESSEDVCSILLAPLIDLGLPGALANILACEMSKLTGVEESERGSVLDSILCVTEALSVTDKYSHLISSNRDIFVQVLSLVKLPEKSEVASACVTAIVLIANIFADEPNLISEASEDVTFLESLLDILPLVSDDLQARSALWCVLERLLLQIEEIVAADSSSSLQKYAMVLVKKSNLVVEDLVDHQPEDSAEGDKDLHKHQKTANAQITSLSRIASILDRCVAARHGASSTSSEEEDEKLHRLLSYCIEYIT